MKCEKCDILLEESEAIYNTIGIHCRPCWLKISGNMNVGEWASFMKAEHPDIDKAWND